MVEKFNPAQPRDPAGSSTGGQWSGSADFRQSEGTTAEEMRAEPLPSTLAAAEERIRREPNEHAFVCLPNGTPVIPLGNDKPNYVLLNPQEGYVLGSKDDPFSGAVFTHNHPSGNSFSPDDVNAAIRHNMAEMRAVTREGTFIMRPSGKWPHPDLVTHELNIVDGQVRTETIRRINAGLVSISEANKNHWRNVWPQIAQLVRLGQDKSGLVYSFEAAP